ncbi:MAG: hypothetical protein GY768_16770 [Planctomycetaceae bacterium]|nr:hypothetical protein [Planctomycetaceae bacterium]
MRRSYLMLRLMTIAATIAFAKDAAAGTYHEAVLADEPVAYWRLGETDGDISENTGLLGQEDIAHGLYTAEVELGQSSLVSGESDSSTLFRPGGRMITEPFEKFDDVLGVGGAGSTVEFWTSFASLPAGFVNLVGDGDGGLDFNMMVYAGPGGFIRPHIQTDEGFASLDSVRQIQAGEIVHVVSTWDIDSGDFLLYLDGEEAEVTQSAGMNPIFGELINRDNQVYIGQDNREQSPTAWLDEVALYNYALEPARIQAHYDAGKGADPPQLPEIPKGPGSVNVSLSTDVLGRGSFANNHSTPDGMVEIIRQVPNSAGASVVAYTADGNGPTIDVEDFIVDGGTAGAFGSNQYGRGGNIWVKGDGEADVAHEGLGGHANWVITYDLDDVRSEIMGDASGPLRLTGSYGSWGSIGDVTDAAGVTQGLVYVDGQRVDDLRETTHNLPTAGGEESQSQAFDISLPTDARYLTLGILSGPGSTFWDDGLFRNVRLRVADPVLDRQDGLVSYWNFDEASVGTDMAQDQPGGNLGAFEATAERTDGLVGEGAALFNNTAGDAVNVGSGDDNNLSFERGITIEALIQSDWLGGDYDEVFRKEDGGNRLLFAFQDDGNNGGANPPVDSGPVLSFGLNVDGYGELDMPLDGEDGRPTVDDIADGETHHLVASFDSETGEKAIWIDGEKLWAVDLGAGSLISSGGGAMATIGNVGPNGGEPFSGIIDEVAIWERALSADEISLHFANVMAGGSYFSGGNPFDFDGDGLLTVVDLDRLLEEVRAGTNRSAFDVNSDDLVNTADIEAYVNGPEILNSYIGDANLDGAFNSTDLVVVFRANKYESGEFASWAQGDWTGDGYFDSGDLVLAFVGGGYEIGSREATAIVPEPTVAASSVLLGAVFILYRRRRH